MVGTVGTPKDDFEQPPGRLTFADQFENSARQRDGRKPGRPSQSIPHNCQFKQRFNSPAKENAADRHSFWNLVRSVVVPQEFMPMIGNGPRWSCRSHIGRRMVFKGET
jgi:hypothetical protein